MAPNKETKRCEFCWRPWGPICQDHNDGCPQGTWSFGLMGQWKQGWEAGFSEERLPYNRSLLPKAFLLGHRVGKAEIDRLVDEAAQVRCF